MKNPPKVRLELASIGVFTYFNEAYNRFYIKALNQARNLQDALAAQEVIWEAILQEKRFSRKKSTCKLICVLGDVA